MARDGSGTYSLAATMAVSGQVASSTTVNSVMNDIATALTDSINKDGTKAFAANQSMGGNKLTSLGAATLLSDAAQYGQVQNGVVAQATTVGGTVDAITLSFTPAITAYATSQRLRWTSGGYNTIAGATVNVNGLGAKTIKKNPGAVALGVGDLGPSGTINEAVYNGTNFVLLTPLLDGPAIDVSKSSQSLSSNTATVITLATENLDSNSNFASNKFTPSVSGYYMLIGQIYMVSSANVMTYPSLSIRKNGATNIATSYMGASTVVNYTDLNLCCVGFVSANGSTDYFELVAQAVFGSGTLLASGSLLGTLIRRA